MNCRLIIVFILAGLVTALQFALLPLFSSDAVRVNDVEQISVVRIVHLPDVEAPAAEKEEPPEPPEAEPINLDSAMDLNIELQMPAFEINPRLETGIALQMPGSYSLGDLDQRPISIYRAEPFYPPRARQRGIQGWVRVEFVINAAGRAEQIKIIESVPQGCFDASVIKALNASTFKPGMFEGEAVPTRTATRYGFEL